MEANMVMFKLGDKIKLHGFDREVLAKTLDGQKIYIGRLGQVWNEEKQMTEWKYVDIQLRYMDDEEKIRDEFEW